MLAVLVPPAGVGVQFDARSVSFTVYVAGASPVNVVEKPGPTTACGPATTVVPAASKIVA